MPLAPLTTLELLEHLPRTWIEHALTRERENWPQRQKRKEGGVLICIDIERNRESKRLLLSLSTFMASLMVCKSLVSPITLLGSAYEVIAVLSSLFTMVVESCPRATGSSSSVAVEVAVGGGRRFFVVFVAETMSSIQKNLFRKLVCCIKKMV